MKQEEIKEIRNQLRLRMNGVVSTSMREKGISYKLNFGVSFPDLKEIASMHTQNSELSQELWKEDIREFKILAILLQPKDELKEEEAKEWISSIRYMEIAEIGSKYLFSNLPYAKELFMDIIFNTNSPMESTIGLLSIAYILTKGEIFSTEDLNALLVKAVTICTQVEPETWNKSRGAVAVLKAYGNQSKEKANEVLEDIKYLQEGTPFHKEIYDELKFEFEYSL